MNGQTHLRDQRWTPVKWRPVPGWSAILIAAVAHLIALLLFLTWHTEKIHISRSEYQVTQMIPGSARLVLNTTPPRTAGSSARLHARIRRTRVPKVVSVPPGTPTQILQEQAKQA